MSNAEDVRTFTHHMHWENEPCRRTCHGGILRRGEEPGVVRLQTWGENCRCFSQRAATHLDGGAS